MQKRQLLGTEVRQESGRQSHQRHSEGNELQGKDNDLINNHGQIR
jgi:hypothetical protein